MIEFHQVTKQFKRATVLDNFSLHVERGERIALIGSNGAGKTTLIRCLLGEYTHGGEIRVDGLAPRHARRQLLHRVGFVPQLPPALKMPVGELLRFSAALCSTDLARVNAVAARLGLDTEKVKRLPFVKLSGGQKQKVLIAIALGRNSDLLILDEPAANLDPEARHAFFKLLAERVEVEHNTMLISSHRLDEVAPLVSRVLELDLGHVVLDDKVADEVSLSGRVICHLILRRADPAIAKAFAEWGLAADVNDTHWTGAISGPDRLRFLGMLARYVGILTHIHLEEKS